MMSMMNDDRDKAIDVENDEEAEDDADDDDHNNDDNSGPIIK